MANQGQGGSYGGGGYGGYGGYQQPGYGGGYGGRYQPLQFGQPRMVADPAASFNSAFGQMTPPPQPVTDGSRPYPGAGFYPGPIPPQNVMDQRNLGITPPPSPVGNAATGGLESNPTMGGSRMQMGVAQPVGDYTRPYPGAGFNPGAIPPQNIGDGNQTGGLQPPPYANPWLRFNRGPMGGPTNTGY